MNTHSVYKRNFLLTAGMILISFCLLGAAFITLSYQYTVQEKRATLEGNAVYVSQFTGQALESGLSAADTTLQNYLATIAMISNSNIILCENDGEIVFSAQGEGEQEELRGSYVPESILKAVSEKGSFIGNAATLYQEPHFVAAKGITVRTVTGERTVGIALVTANTASMVEMWSSFAAIFFFTMVVVLCIAFISSAITSLHQTKPLHDMADTVRRFGLGEYDLRLPDYKRKDEVGELAAAFNAMADSIAKSEERRREFVANISHELKTPMTTIAGFTDGILDGTIPPERTEESLRVVSAETRRLSRLVRRMLDLSQLQAQAEETVVSQGKFDVAEVMCRVLASLEGKITGRDLDVDAQLPEEPLMVWGDPDAITQVCYNLLDNAIKFSTPGQVIGVRMETKGDKAYISVKNTGETIPPEELNMIFDRFHKTDHSRSVDKEGVGLGLYIVQTILNTHKESITVTSQDGVTQFTFTMTLAK